jgi:hypothetical protein
MLFGCFVLLMFIGGVINNFSNILFINELMKKLMLFLDNSLVKKEYLILLVFLFLQLF